MTYRRTNATTFTLLAMILLLLIPEVQSRHHSAEHGRHRQNYTSALKALSRIYYTHRTGSFAPENTSLYCGCTLIYRDLKPAGFDSRSCGFVYRRNPVRGSRIEWEHAMPAHYFGGALGCWQRGGRRECRKNPGFAYMEGDMHNLFPAVGELNADRGNFPFAPLPGLHRMYGNCPMKVDFRRRLADPPDRARGPLARAYLYMSWRYALKLAPDMERTYNLWNRRHPPTPWECRRNQEIARIQGNDNPFITKACRSGKP